MSTVFSLPNLPQEITECILTQIPHPYELLQLACTCSFLCDLIIPRHIEYRVLRLPLTESKELDHIWPHLVERPDLTCNIRKVIIPRNDGDVLVYPKRLVNVDAASLSDETHQKREKTMISALRLMVNLESFTWRWNDSPPTTKMLEFIVNTVSFLPSMKEMELMTIVPSSDESYPIEFPITTGINSHLQYLRVDGTYWGMSPLLTLTGNWLRASTSLESLRIHPSLISRNHKLSFPLLFKLKILPCESHPVLSEFLSRHDAIRILDWPCLGSTTLQPRILPNLRSLRCDVKFLKAINEADSSVDDLSLHRPIERLVLPNGWWADQDEIPLCNYTFLDHTKLLYLSLQSTRLSGLHQLARTFPMIKELQLRQVRPVVEMEDICSALRLFVNLEVLQYGELWQDLQIDHSPDQVDARIRNLVAHLPNLRQLNYPSFQKKQIMIIRGEPVTYSIEDRGYAVFPDF